MYGVILAGGGGTRLWPLSGPDRPKPFLPLLAAKSLLQQTVARLSPLISSGDVFVVTDERYVPLVREQLPDVPADHIVGEPEARNTAAAVVTASLLFERPASEVMVVLPADHQVVEEQRFRDTLASAAELAGDRSLVTLGIEPHGPATRFGYIVRTGEPRLSRGLATYRVERFVEKPDEPRARELLATGAAYWNAGILVWRRDELLDGLERYSADIFEPVQRALTAGDELRAFYPSLRATSIDYALLEPAAAAGTVAVVPAAVEWSDIGSWPSLLAAICQHPEREFAATIVPAGEAVQVQESDLAVYRNDGRLVVTPCRPGVVTFATPAAVLVDAREHEPEIEALLERVSGNESHA
jgi:mannose-1-phosphate guanylyltransferase